MSNTILNSKHHNTFWQLISLARIEKDLKKPPSGVGPKSVLPALS